MMDAAARAAATPMLQSPIPSQRAAFRFSIVIPPRVGNIGSTEVGLKLFLARAAFKCVSWAGDYLFGESRESTALLQYAILFRSFRFMSVEVIKEKLATLPRKEQDEVIAYLFHLRHEEDAVYQENISRRSKDTDPLHWLSPDQFERALDKREGA